MAQFSIPDVNQELPDDIFKRYHLSLDIFFYELKQCQRIDECFNLSLKAYHFPHIFCQSSIFGIISFRFVKFFCLLLLVELRNILLRGEFLEPWA